jgi:hypothetical protein
LIRLSFNDGGFATATNDLDIAYFLAVIPLSVILVARISISS